MQANIPRGWHRLPPKGKQAIADYLQKITKEQCEKDMRIVLDLYIKMVCVVLHDAFLSPSEQDGEGRLAGGIS